MSGEWYDDFDDPGDDDVAETLPCPACGSEIYEEAEQCPSCGRYVVRETGVLTDKPVWYALLALAGIIGVIVVFSGLVALL